MAAQSSIRYVPAISSFTAFRASKLANKKCGRTDVALTIIVDDMRQASRLLTIQDIECLASRLTHTETQYYLRNAQCLHAPRSGVVVATGAAARSLFIVDQRVHIAGADLSSALGSLAHEPHHETVRGSGDGLRPRSVPNTDINFQLSIPETAASSGNGDIYFQISAPTTYSWVALGQGNGMSGSNMFVVYTSADGNNVTVSPRLGRGQVMPEYNSNADISVLEGSGVSNGVMTANVRCGSCSSWDGGSMDFSSSSSNWIYGYRSGSPLESDSVEESISQHNDANGFTWDLSVARTSDVDASDPFASGSGSGESTTATPTGSSPTTSISCQMVVPTGRDLALTTVRPLGPLTRRGTTEMATALGTAAMDRGIITTNSADVKATMAVQQATSQLTVAVAAAAAEAAAVQALATMRTPFGV
ncbi:hypothetical protein KC325_g125 [Hortaea werneckii]|nr:hypothetical protein KC325_g125 [Hortaea werneckii]